MFKNYDQIVSVNYYNLYSTQTKIIRKSKPLFQNIEFFLWLYTILYLGMPHHLNV